MSSWQCTEGPYGRYPGEDGYEGDLDRHEHESFRKKMDRYFRSDDGEDLPEYWECRAALFITETIRKGKVPWAVMPKHLSLYLLDPMLKYSVPRALIVRLTGQSSVKEMENSIRNPDNKRQPVVLVVEENATEQLKRAMKSERIIIMAIVSKGEFIPHPSLDVLKPLTD